MPSAPGLVSLATGFFGFWIAMVVMSLGELVLVPTSSSYASILAPADKRGRYMGLYGLTWSVAVAIGPVFGGLLNDHISPQAIWIGGLLVGMVGAAGFLMQASEIRRCSRLWKAHNRVGRVSNPPHLKHVKFTRTESFTKTDHESGRLEIYDSRVVGLVAAGRNL